MSQTVAALAPLVVAAFVLVGVPLMVWRSELADEQARSRTPPSGSTNAGHDCPQPWSGRTGVEPTPATVMAPPVPLALAGVDAAPLSTSAGLDSPLPTKLGGHGVGDPQASRVRRARTPVGGAPAARNSPPTGHHPGDHHG